MTRIHEISKAFSKQAHEYEVFAKVQTEIGQRLLGRLQYMRIDPRYILDLGCGTGQFSAALRAGFPKAEVIGLDLAKAMLSQAQAKGAKDPNWSLVAGDMHKLPFADGVFDLVFANQVIHWSAPLGAVLGEINRVMQAEGCLMFTTLGPDTFKEIRTSWQGVNDHAHVNAFADMHDVGDALVQERFLDPVMDTEQLAIHYASLQQLLASLKAQGVRNVHAARNHSLTGKAAWQAFADNYALLRTEAGQYPLSYEVVYGQAWKGQQRKTAAGIETAIPLSQLRVQ